MHLRRLMQVGFLAAVLALSQPGFRFAFAQDSSGAQQDDSADQASQGQAPQDQAPAPAADDAHWWLKRGGTTDVATIFPLKIQYQRFWQFRTDGLAQLDTIYLDEVMVGGALADEKDIVHQLQGQGKAHILVVENHPQVWYASDDEAVIYDPYVDRSYFVDAKTRAPLGDGSNTAPSTASVAYHLTKHVEPYGELTWMVDAIVQINLQ